MVTATQTTSVKCPVCQSPFTVPVQSIIDVGRQPELKTRFLQGYLNTFQCPKCGNVGMLSLPLLYHDPDKELLFFLTPTSMTLQRQDTEKTIGTLTNALMNSLPPEKRKAYLFQPKIFLSMESMIEAVLEADGITKEMIEAQKARLSLIDSLLEVKQDEKKFKQLVSENESLLDREFFQMLTSIAAAAQAESQGGVGRELIELRQKLMPLTEAGRELQQAENQLREEIRLTKAQLLHRVIESEDEKELEALVRAGRPYMDYAFFQDLTRKIESSSPEEAKRLTRRRQQILDISERQDEEAKQLLSERADLLKRLLQSDDPKGLLEQEVEMIDEPFFTILSANIQQASQGGRNELVQALQQVAALAMQVIRDKAPPSIRLLNDLMEADFPEETRKLLQDNEGQLSEEFYDMLKALAEEMETRGQASVAERLRKIEEQAQTVKA